MGDTSHPRVAGLPLTGRGRTFAAYLRPGVVVPEAEAPGLPAPCAMVYPHRRRVEAALGGPIATRALLDPAGCRDRGVDGYVEGSVACFAASDPSFELALLLATSALTAR